MAVLGAGIVGICCAIELQKAGFQVELIDRRNPGSETSSGNAGVFSLGSIAPLASPALLPRLPGLIANQYSDFRMHYPHLLPLIPWLLKFLLRCNRKTYFQDGVLIDAMMVPSLQAHLELMNQSMANHLAVRNGTLRLYRHQASFERDSIDRELLEHCKVDFEVVYKQGIRDLEPDLSDLFTRAVWVKRSVSLKNPRELCELYAKYFQALGGTIKQQDLESIHHGDSGWSVRTKQGENQYAKLVLCLGAWTPRLLKPLGYKNPIAIERGYHMMLRSQMGNTLHRPVFDVDRSYVMIPMEDGIRVTTGTNLTWRETAATPLQLHQVLPSAFEAFPLTESLLDEPWMGRRPSTADSLPLIGPAPRHDNLWLAFGHAHMGLGLGPITGQIIASQISGNASPIDASNCSPSRYL